MKIRGVVEAPADGQWRKRVRVDTDALGISVGGACLVRTSCGDFIAADVAEAGVVTLWADAPVGERVVVRRARS